MLRRRWSALLSALVALAALTIPVSSADAAGSTTRLAGEDRYATAVAISRSTFPAGAGAVFVASGQSFADGLAGGPGATRLDAPLLLVESHDVPRVVISEIKRLRPRKIYVLGGKNAVSAGAAAQLASLSRGGVQRLSGDDRYATSASVAGLWRASSTVYIATGSAFPDALSGGAAAARAGAPLLLTRRSTLPAATRGALSRLRPSHVIIVGGTGVVTAAVKRSVESLLPRANVSRVGGDDRYETSARLLTASAGAGGHSGTVMLASGQNYPDALAGIPASASRNTWFALVRRTCAPKSVRSALQSLSVTSYVLLGGTTTLSGSSGTATCSPPPPPGGWTLAQARKVILDDTNDFRASHGMAPLTVMPALESVAQKWTDRMARHGFEHNPNLLAQIPGSWTSAGENIAAGFRPDQVVADWIKSPVHRKNLLGSYNRIGIGYTYVSGSTYRSYFTQDFARY